MKKTTIFATVALSLVLSLTGCDKNYHAVFGPDELGMEDHEYYVEKDGDEVTIAYLSNKAGTISLVNEADAEWVQLESDTFGDTDGEVSVRVSPNAGFRRRADILFRTDTRKDTISVLQKGAVEDLFRLLTYSVLVYNGTGATTSVSASINVPLEDISVEVRLSGEEEWIKDYQLTPSAFTFRTSDNPDEDYVRRASVILTYVDGWRETQELKIGVVQARADNTIGTMFTPEALHNAATVEGYTLPEDAIIEGYIVSTTEGRNAGDAQVEDFKQGTGVIDYTLTDRTSYLESADGLNGFRLIATLEEKNDFARYSRITLNVGGAVIKKSEGEPVHYTIEGISSDNILASVDATSSMPWKEKHITELTDSDINTLVTIKDCEIAMRKGPFTPVNEGYGSIFSAHRLAKYPILIRDITGGSMYMYTNMTCPYRRNGETLPYGSGDITGIVVHELYTNFEKDGDIGRYQLRHLVREEIELQQDFADNFSGLITEFRYAIFPEDEEEETILPKPILATKGNGELCHTYGSVSNYSPSYFYIGKCGSSRKGKYAEGAGIELDGGGIYQPWVDKHTESAQNDDGKGWYKDNLKLSWSNKYWWDSSNDRGYCWLVVFNTQGIVSDKVSMQFAMYNNSQKHLAPRYWKAQYSLTTHDCSKSSDPQWKDIGEFTVHDVAVWGYENEWQTMGTRVYDFPLPTEILGKESVSIRLMPKSNKAGPDPKKEEGDPSYDGSSIANNTGYNTMDYFAVRYNK